MPLGRKAWTAIILPLVILALTVAPTWSMFVLIFIGMIAAGIEMIADDALACAADAAGNSAFPEDFLAIDVEGLLNFAVGAAEEMRRNLDPSRSPSGLKHEVFLNFRGLDTREEFTDVLHHFLLDAGISVFGADPELPLGEEIEQRKEAIKMSRISIAILSKNYASSEGCLDELVQMWKCRESNGQTIIPIFYDVSPTDVRELAGDFGEAFNRHVIDGVDPNTTKTWKKVLRPIGRLMYFNQHERTKRIDKKTIETWREVLRGVGGYSGYEWKLYNRREGQLVKEVVGRVVQVLEKEHRLQTMELVGIDHHVEKMMRKLGVVFSGGKPVKVRGDYAGVVGICGVQAVGKTTLAKVVYNKIYKLFDACSFLADISSERLQLSQQKLITDLLNKATAPPESSGEGIKMIASLFCNVKVLILLDDVGEDEQIKALAGKLTWFGPGSRIIVTTRKRSVLNAFDDGADAGQGVKEYEVEPMSDDHALQLFCKHAFRGDAPQEYGSLCIDFVKAIGGLPRDIVHYASDLGRTKDINVWRSTLELLKKHPEDSF